MCVGFVLTDGATCPLEKNSSDFSSTVKKTLETIVAIKHSETLYSKK
jgi:hypothetical protein